MPTADELMEVARACAEKLDLSDGRRLPSLQDVEDLAEDDYAHLLDLLQEDEVFGGTDFDRQRELSQRIEAALPEPQRSMMEELTDQHLREIWLLQEAAFHVGLAVGLRLARAKPK
jgi:MoxR-like ATPase